MLPSMLTNKKQLVTKFAQYRANINQILVN